MEGFETVDTKRFTILTITNSGIIALAIALYTAFLVFIFPLIDFTVLIRAEAFIIFSIQKLFSVPVTIQDSSLIYSAPFTQGLKIIIIPECLGIAEIVLFLFILAAFRGASNIAKIKGALLFAPVIFAENIIRILLLYPTGVLFGLDTMWDIHYLIWHYGQFALLMIFFAMWYVMFAKPQLLSSLHNPVRVKHTNKKQKRKGSKKVKSK